MLNFPKNSQTRQIDGNSKIYLRYIALSNIVKSRPKNRCRFYFSLDLKFNRNLGNNFSNLNILKKLIKNPPL